MRGNTVALTKAFAEMFVNRAVFKQNIMNIWQVSQVQAIAEQTYLARGPGNALRSSCSCVLCNMVCGNETKH